MALFVHFDRKLHQFCDAVRSKQDWFVKILDQHDLGLKWAKEAQLVMDGVQNDEYKDVILALQDLEAEARRIRILDRTIRLQSTRLPDRNVNYQTLDTDVEQAVDLIRRAKYAIRPPSLKEEVGVYISDGLVPPSLHRELAAEFDALAALEPTDFHPGSNGKVQDLIHPSLYPYVADVTLVEDPSRKPALRNGKFTTMMVNDSSSITFESKYAWMPSVFCVSDDGKDVHISSYINGLGPRDRFPVLYRLIEKVFLVVLPHLEHSVEFQYQYQQTPSVSRWYERETLRESTTREAWEDMLERQEDEKAKQLDIKFAEREALEADMQREADNPSRVFQNTSTPSLFQGQELKVIVKAANYNLKPGEQYSGSWHLEGMPHERIVASAIYYYDADPEIVDEGLSLRRLREEMGEEFPNKEDLMHENFEIHFAKANDESDDEDEDIEDEDIENDYPSDWEQTQDYRGNIMPMSTSNIPAHFNLGTVTTAVNSASNSANRGTGKILSFPNWIQHKVAGVSNNAAVADQSKGCLAKRKILCFFLVRGSEPTIQYHGFQYTGLLRSPVVSTADVISQERSCNLLTLHFLLPIACQRSTGHNLPPELVNLIIKHMGLGMSREDAEKHRRALMEDRKFREVNKYDRDLWEHNYSLCEH